MNQKMKKKIFVIPKDRFHHDNERCLSESCYSELFLNSLRRGVRSYVQCGCNVLAKFCLVEILKMKCDQDLCLNLFELWYAELNPRVRCAFGNVSHQFAKFVFERRERHQNYDLPKCLASKMKDCHAKVLWDIRLRANGVSIIQPERTFWVWAGAKYHTFLCGLLTIA